MRTAASVGSSPAGSEGRDQQSGGGMTTPLWRRILDKLSGIWLVVDGLGTLIIIASALYMALHLGVWTLGLGLIVFEILGMLNSFYVGHRQLTRS